MNTCCFYVQVLLKTLTESNSDVLDLMPYRPNASYLSLSRLRVMFMRRGIVQEQGTFISRTWHPFQIANTLM